MRDESDEPTSEEILGRMPEGVYMVNGDWEFTCLSDRAEELLPAADGESNNGLWDELPSASGTVFEDRLRRAMDEGEPAEFEYHDEEVDGWYNVCARPVGENLAVYISEIDDEVETRRTLERTNRQLVLINRIMRHDIRNDMSVVLGWGEELRNHVDAEGEEILERMLGTTRHAVRLTETARDFIEVVTPGDTASLEAVPLADAVDAEVARCRSMFGDAEITVGEVPEVEVVANALLSSVLGNIIGNAVEHNDKEVPRVEVGFEADDENVTIRIADNGPGIPSERRDDVFGRGDEGLDHPAAGFGLRLVDTVVTGYGGEVRVEENSDEGSVFVVELRRADSDTGGGTDG